MNLGRCPCCHSRLHLDALVQDDAGRDLLLLLSGLEVETGRALVAYLTLFRPARRDLANDRAVRLARGALELGAGLSAGRPGDGAHRDRGGAAPQGAGRSAEGSCLPDQGGTDGGGPSRWERSLRLRSGRASDRDGRGGLRLFDSAQDRSRSEDRSHGAEQDLWRDHGPGRSMIPTPAERAADLERLWRQAEARQAAEAARLPAVAAPAPRLVVDNSARAPAGIPDWLKVAGALGNPRPVRRPGPAARGGGCPTSTRCGSGSGLPSGTRGIRISCGFFGLRFPSRKWERSIDCWTIMR